MSDALDCELIGLINKLNKIQAEIGGGKQKDSIAAKHGGKIDRFIDLKMQIGERLEVIKTTIDDVKKYEKMPGSNPKDLIGSQSKLRNELSCVTDEWRELDTIFRLETKKRRSKFSPEELAERQNMLVDLQNQIQDIKEMQRAGYVKGYQGNRLTKMEDSEMFRPKDITNTGPGGTPAPGGIHTRGVTGTRNNNMTDENRMQLMALKERDNLIVSALTSIICSMLKLLFVSLFFARIGPGDRPDRAGRGRAAGAGPGGQRGGEAAEPHAGRARGQDGPRAREGHQRQRATQENPRRGNKQSMKFFGPIYYIILIISTPRRASLTRSAWTSCA